MNHVYTPREKQQFRTLLMAEGQKTADRLARLLAGEDLRLEDMQGLDLQNKGEPPKVRLRRFLDHLTATLRTVDNDEFGRCSRCTHYIPATELGQMPWADTCLQCASRR